MGTVVVRGGASGFAQEVIAGSHRLAADEPVAAGGTDTGPSPYDYLLVALSGPLSGEQRARLLEIAERCPVHRTLTSEISIQSRLT